ncbi:MAG: hypothetical protein ABS95_02475 [Verrucomicrobia bacterium SCN 57-15]|nr:MAG: hypothetical protein ABS95_02475 [Verrucomicrobia bacterium SCN 57-15]
MSDPKSKVTVPALFGQTKTLWLNAPGRTGVLLTRIKSGYRERAMRFTDAHAALEWCMKNAVVLIFLPSDPARN